MILGLSGETSDDIKKTLKLVRYLEKQNTVIFPVFYEPLYDGQKPFTIDDMRSDHLELYRTCYEINFKMVPLLFWDNQRAGGVSWLKRAAIRILGKTEVAAWRKSFRKIQKQLQDGRVAGINYKCQ